jgi:glutamine---fructose-6-phosphate transaminase (isomerizing)
MSTTRGRLAEEIREAPEAVRRQEQSLAGPAAALASRLQRRPPQVAVTCARGSSAHAAAFGKHLIERHLGIPVAAAAPNIASVYGRELNLKDQLFLAISQSGRSDDLIEMTAAAKKSGAVTTAILNDVSSPLAAHCDLVLSMGAGPELSVAATKTFVATLAALLRLTSAWTGSAKLDAALSRLPDRLAAASDLDWSGAANALSCAASLVTIGRGPTLAIAREAALKLKEICNLHAEAFSGAEFMHGPVALVSSRYPILMFMPADEGIKGMQRLAADLRSKSAALFTAEPAAARKGTLPALASDHPETDAVCLIQSFYIMAVQLAAKLGIDASQPRHLNKITRTR